MKPFLLFSSLSFFLLLPHLLAAQETITVTGSVMDVAGEDPLVGASVVVRGKAVGTVTNQAGDFRLFTGAENLPVILVVSSAGYGTKEVIVSGSTSILIIRLEYQALMMGDELVISASRVEESILESPVSIEKMDILDIQSVAAPSFYNQIASLKGIDLSVSSLSYASVNPRGFGTNGNGRVVQLIDGIDNQLPSLSFSPGNLAGISELDLESVEILPGTASALYGPNAINGIILMNSKNPFEYQGLSANAKLGVTHLDGVDDDPSPYQDYALRYARAFNDRFAFKVTGEYRRVADFRGVDYRDGQYAGAQVEAEGVSPTNRPGRRAYDGVNVYGEPLVNLGAVAENEPSLAPIKGLLPSDESGNFTPTGYTESSILDNTVANVKLSGALHYRVTDDVEALVQYNYAGGNSVYTTIDRFALKNFTYQTAKAELRGTNFFVRAYRTRTRSDNYGLDALTSLINVQTTVPRYVETFARARLQGLTVDESHGAARTASDALRTQNLASGRFQQLFDSLRAVPLSEGGAKVIDDTRLWHYEGMYNFAPLTDVARIIVGATFRRYLPGSKGTLLALRDNGDEFVIDEWGTYVQASKNLLDDRLDITASARYDKNENFRGQFSPRIAGVYTLLGDHHIRASFQQGFRIPPLSDQLLDIGSSALRFVGSNPVLSNRYNFQSNPLYLAPSIGQAQENFRTTGDVAASVALLKPLVEREFKPERISTYEIGYRGALGDNLLIDAYYYFNSYTNFSTGITAVQSAGPANDPDGDQQPPFIGEADPEGIVRDNINVQPFRLIVSADGQVNTHGFAVGIDYVLPKNFVLETNASYHQLLNQEVLLRQNSEVAYNAPRWRYNIKLSNRKLTENLGFSLFWHWQEAFIWELGFPDRIPAYQTLDAQLSYKVSFLKTVIKLGGANILNERYTTATANPRMGAVYYLSVTFDEFLN